MEFDFRDQTSGDQSMFHRRMISVAVFATDGDASLAQLWMVSEPDVVREMRGHVGMASDAGPAATTSVSSIMKVKRR